MNNSIEEIDIDTDEGYSNNNNNSDDEEKLTTTIIAQNGMTESIKERLKSNKAISIIETNKIIKFLNAGIETIPESHQSLDSSKVWISFWIFNGLDMLNALDEYPNISKRASDYFSILQNDKSGGGFGGGNSHTSHVVSTFASVSALYAIGTEEVYKVINREEMYGFLMRMKTKDGAFTSEDGGEYDSRTTYCAIAVASMLNILTDDLIKGTIEFLVRCQTYEGGFGAYPGNEAHGGYTFCAVAALSILNSLNRIDMDSLHRWLTFRQPGDGGFQGRTNKLVDTCYSYWQGAVYIIIQNYYDTINNNNNNNNNKDTNINDKNLEKLLFNQKKLQQYIVQCCQQHDKKFSGFSDHPTRHRDFYHTCYSLSGLSLSQHNDIPNIISTMNSTTHNQTNPPITKTSDTFTIDSNSTIVEPIHPIYNIKLSKCEKGLKYFYSLNKINK